MITCVTEDGFGSMKKLFSLLSTLALLVVLALTVLLVGVRIIGLTPYSVLSGSMEPAYSVGDLLYVKEIEPEDIEIGMPITFVANENLVIVTHRVVDVTKRTTKSEPVMLENGKAAMGKDGKPLMQEVELDEPVYYFLTRGDANAVTDVQQVYEKNIIGTPVYAVPYLGYFTTLLQTDAGKVMALCFGLMLVLLMFLPEMLAAIDASEKKKHASAEDNNKEETPDKEPESQAAEDILVCEKSDGDDVVIKDRNAPQGDDILVCEEKQGDDAIKVDANAQ